ncbi:MAG: hypothetical protein KGJ37_04275, partial [Verrucomicrobiota bacterium]|nr:hypothetical protein [Verrucomicrobiota bacterium]
MTLVEVMIALGILAFSAITLMGLTYFISISANDNVNQNTAMIMAQGYLEQLCRLPYSNVGPYSSTNLSGLVNIADDTGGTSVPIYLTSSAGGWVANENGGNFGNGSWSKETVYLDQDNTGTHTFPMTFEFQPALTDLS